MRTSKFFAVPTLALGAILLSAGPAMAHSDHGGASDGAATSTSSESWSFQTSLAPLNNSGTVGDVLIEGHGNQATGEYEDNYVVYATLAG